MCASMYFLETIDKLIMKYSLVVRKTQMLIYWRSNILYFKSLTISHLFQQYSSQMRFMEGDNELLM